MTLGRERPRGLLRLGLRLPIPLYRCGLGFLLGKRFLLLAHRGRVSGRERHTVLEVVRHDPQTDSFVVASGWGEGSDWYRNILRHPAVFLHVGRRKVPARAERLSPPQAERELSIYARSHPTAFRALTRVLAGKPMSPTPGTLQKLAQAIPVVVLRVTG